MMKKTARILCAACAALFVCGIFVTNADAMPDEVRVKRDQVSEGVFSFDAYESQGYISATEDIINTTAVGNENVQTNAAYDVWHNYPQHSSFAEKAIVVRSLRMVSLGITSNSTRTVTISASATSNGSVTALGLERIQLQRYCNGRWLTVFNRNNQVSINTSRFSFSITNASLISSGIYRVRATFVSYYGNMKTTVTRTTDAIRCR